MRSRVFMAGIAATLAIVPLSAQAQTALTGEELRGNTVDVLFADGTRNAVFFGGNGAAAIVSPDGMRAAGSWAVRGDKLCLAASGATECWSYARRFVAGDAVTLTSSCNETSQWTARSVNAPVQEAAPAIIRGERG